ncbi:glycoside hydrolase family 73 protein [Clostridium saccharoperbutylacetonicum]|uniref:glycoside hydrolase family 73 protein n=1 Tax=Clostridium saccharoperbutylacetonicum TaxID=36745 RepID=UPI0039E8C70B
MKKWLLSTGLTVMMPLMLVFFILVVMSGGASGSTSGKGKVTPATPTATEAEFIERIAAGAKLTQNEYGVLASVTMGQAILESGWGKSGLAIEGNNLFGVKADSRWTGPTLEMRTTEEVDGGIISIMATWRAYNSWDDSVLDHGRFLKENSRYAEAGLFQATDYRGQVQALKNAGYATESDYVNLVCGVIESYGLNKYD